MSDRRVVRVSTDFFDQLDSQLGAERGPAGEPSATDFIVFDLVRAFVVYGLLLTDVAIELIGVDIEIP